MTLTELAVKRPSLIVVIFSVLTFLGVFSYMTLGYELMPKFSLPIVTITTAYPGASPKEVETSVSKKIEDAVAVMEGISTIRSISQESFSTVIIEFNAGTKIDDAVLDAQRKLNAVISTLPTDAKTPSVSKISFSEAPIIRMGVAGKVSPTELFDVVKQRIVPALTKINGVGAVDLVGGEEREIRINVNKKKLEAYNISILQVSQAIQKSNLDFPTGKIKTQDNQNLIRLAGKFKSIKELETVIIATDRAGSPIYLSQVAEVQDAQKEIEKITHVDGNNSIGLMIRKQSDANAVEVKKQVMKELASLEKMYAKQQIKFSIAQDTTEFTMKAAEAVMEDLLLAVLLVASVMLLFLHSWRNALIVMVAIPASIVSTFIAMFVLGFTLNLMTLLALSLVVGILVDDSIVVLENIHRHLEMGKDPQTAALDGRQEIGFSAMSITLVDVVVFLPIALVSGLISNILRQFSLVVVVSTLMSLFVSFTVTPLLASRFSKAEHLNPKTFFGAFIIWFEKQLDYLTASYISLLKVSLRYKLLTLMVAFGLFFSSFLLGTYGFIGSEFVTTGDRGEFIINVELPKDATVEQTNRISQKAEKLLFENKYVTGIFTTVGATSELIGGQATVFKAELNVKLVERAERPYPSGIMATLIRNEIAEKIAGAKITTSEVSFTGQANNAPLQFVLAGNNNDTLFKYAQILRDKISKIPGTVNIKLSAENGNPEISVQIDKKRMSDLGLSMDAVGATMQNAFSGNDKSEFEDGDYNYDINIKLDDFDRKNIDDVASLIFVNNQGQNIKLSQFSQINQTTGASKLERRGRMSSVVIEGQVLGRTVGDVGGDIDKIIASTKLPTDITVSKDGDLKRQGEAFGSLGFALLASILFMYLIMVALYDSYIYPFVVLFSIPVAIMGALLALALTMSSLSIFSMLGMIMLVGLVAKNAILLVDFANQMKQERGMNTYDALIEAGHTRLRPILMTTIAMVLGMLPIALAKGAGAEWKNGLAWALIGGLSSSMLLTLVVVPVMYSLADSMIAFVNKIMGVTTKEINTTTPEKKEEAIALH